MQRRAICIVLVSVAIPFLWSLDANISLLIYNAYVTSTLSGGITNDEGRRIFPPGSTSLEGKTLWITGASSGIGAELAVQLAHAGAGHLVLSGRRRERLDSVAGRCREASLERMRSNTSAMGVSVVPFDMSAEPDVLDAAVATALEAAPPSGIDFIVLNAGRYQCSLALDTDLDKVLPDLMRVNFESPVQLSQKLIQRDRWKERGRGHVVTIASLMGRGASPLNAAYSASKHALRGYFHSLAAEEGSWLRVDVVLPGATDTGLWDASYDAETSPKDGTNDLSSDRVRRPLHADDRSKMPVERCARVIVSSMIGPRFLSYESWITRNPGLLWVYLASYEPTTFRLLTNLIAPLRVAMWRKRKEDALYLPTLLGQLGESLLDYAAGRSSGLFP